MDIPLKAFKRTYIIGLRICWICWLGVFCRRIRWLRIRRIRWFWVGWIRRRRIGWLLRIRLTVDSNDSDESNANKDLYRRTMTNYVIINTKLVLNEEVVTLPSCWCSDGLDETDASKHCSAEYLYSSCSIEGARRAWLCPFITHLDQSLALCAILWHISVEFRARFTGGVPKTFPLGIIRTSEKVMRLLYSVQPIQYIMTSTHAALHDSPINPYYIAIHLFGILRVGPVSQLYACALNSEHLYFPFIAYTSVSVTFIYYSSRLLVLGWIFNILSIYLFSITFSYYLFSIFHYMMTMIIYPSRPRL